MVRVRLKTTTFFVTVALLAAAAPVWAQVTLAPIPTLVAGPDFASDTYSDPWDFSNVEDISPFPDEQFGWATSASARLNGRSVFLSGGRFSATTDTTAGNKLSLLYRGGNGGVNTGRHGHADFNAIPTNRYGKVAIKVRLGDNAVGAPYQLLATWHGRAYGAPDETNNAGQTFFGITQKGWAIYTLDLTTLDWTHTDGISVSTGRLEKLYPDPAKPVGWTANPLVRGLEIRPTTQPASIAVDIDWIRLTAADAQAGATIVGLTFTGACNSPALEVTDGDAAFRLRGQVVGTTFNFNYGILPPGTYTVRLACSGGTFSTSQQMVINAAPLVKVTDPDDVGGTDFATTELLNAWDMDSLADTPSITGVLSSPAPAISGGKLIATGSGAGDPQVTLLNGGSTLINTRKYRNLTFTLQLDTPFGLDGRETAPDVGDGSLARVFWGSNTGQAANEMTTTDDILIWPGENTYTVDLNSLTVANRGLESECLTNGDNCPQIPWIKRSARYFRMDPHEATKLVQFRLGRVTLAAPDEVSIGNSFGIKYNFVDTVGASTHQANFWLDIDRTPGGLIAIGTQTSGVVPNIPLTYNFNTTSFPTVTAGEYYVYIEIVESQGGVELQRRGAYSTGVLRVFNVTSSIPRVTVSNPASGTTQNTGFEVRGCAYDEGTNTAINMDDVAVFAIAGAGVTGSQAGTTQVLGLGNTLGILEYGPVSGTNVACATAPGVFANAGFRIPNVTGLSPGSWSLRVIARSTISNEFTALPDIPFTVSNSTVSPTNLAASGTGNSITLTWVAPTSGPPIEQYQIDWSSSPSFVPLLSQVLVPTSQTSVTGTLPSGTWSFRVRTIAPGGAPGGASNAVTVTLPWGVVPPTPPGPPVLTATQVAINPIALSWAAGPGGTPSSYTLFAGSAPGGSDLGTYSMGTLTTISANAPPFRVYVRVTATNSAGSATSNEINFLLASAVPPGAPTGLNFTVSPARVVSLNWTASSSGGTATSYTVVARQTVAGPIVATLPGLTSTSFSIGAPPGTYFVTVTAVNAAGSSAASNQVQIVVP